LGGGAKFLVGMADGKKRGRNRREGEDLGRPRGFLANEKLSRKMKGDR